MIFLSNFSLKLGAVFCLKAEDEGGQSSTVAASPRSHIAHLTSARSELLTVKHQRTLRLRCDLSPRRRGQMFTGDLPAEHLLQCVSVFDVLARQTERTFSLFGIKPQQELQVRFGPRPRPTLFTRRAGQQLGGLRVWISTN